MGNPTCKYCVSSSLELSCLTFPYSYIFCLVIITLQDNSTWEVKFLVIALHYEDFADLLLSGGTVKLPIMIYTLDSLNYADDSYFKLSKTDESFMLAGKIVRQVTGT